MYALEPGELAKVTLEMHERIEGAPYCLVKSMSMREQRSFAIKFNSIYDIETTNDFFENVRALFSEYVISFHGYKSEDLEEAFSKDGMIEILRRLLAGRLVSYDEKKS